MNEPKLSVIVPLTGEVDRIKVCLDCLFAQTFKDFEIIIVSNDPTLKVFEQIEGRRIKFFHDAKNSARKLGLENALGDYIYFMDADGLIFENGLELLVAAAEASDAELVHSNTFVERDGEEVSIRTDQPQLEGMLEPDDLKIISDGEFNFDPALNLYRREFLARHRLQLDSTEAFSYAALCLAKRACFISDYFYVRTRTSRPTVDDTPEDSLVDRLYHDEFRAGFFVTSPRKKLWNVQLHLIVEFDRICQKHGLKWFAYAGTLLGAARHGGFVPWDDDVDLAMMRPDYEKLKRVIARELKPEYSVDFWFDYAVEGERNPRQLPVMSRAVFESNAWWPSTASYFKIRDARTSMIEWADRPHFAQGMCIDIFPLDPAPPFDNQRRAESFKFAMQLLLAVSSPNSIDWESLPSKQRKLLKSLVKKPFRERALEYEQYLAEHWYESEYVSHLNSIFAYRRAYDWRREWWDQLIELPFERISLPAPSGFDGVLRAHYGDWREMVITHAHTKMYSADIGYREFFDQIAPEILDFELHGKEGSQ